MRLVLASVFILLSLGLARADTCQDALTTGVYPCSVDVQWTSTTTSETEFDVEKQLNGGAWNFVGKTSRNVTIFTDNILLRSVLTDNTYCYQVKAAIVSATAPTIASAPSAQSPTTCITIPKPFVPPSGIVLTFTAGTGELTIGAGNRKFQFNSQDGKLILNSADIVLDASNMDASSIAK